MSPQSHPDALFNEDGTPAWVEPPRLSESRKGRHRQEDWSTSIAGAADVAYRAGSQKARLLEAFRNSYPDALSDEQAAQQAGISLTSEYSKRCGELRQDGHIQVAYDSDGQAITREGASGIPRIVSLWQETPTPSPNHGRVQGRARNPQEIKMMTERQADLLIEGQPTLVRKVQRLIEDAPETPEIQAEQVVAAVADWLTSYRPADFGDDFCTPLDMTAFILRRGQLGG
jgi:hypothetical protein